MNPLAGEEQELRSKLAVALTPDFIGTHRRDFYGEQRRRASFLCAISSEPRFAGVPSPA
jgi:hypothetical protein